MTMPDEKYRALKKAKEFLLSLMNSKKTPKVPKAIRIEAYRVLKHFPWEHDLEELAKRCPDILGSEKDRE